MIGKRRTFAGGFVATSQIDEDVYAGPTPQQEHAAALTIVEHSTSIDDARELLTMVGLR